MYLRVKKVKYIKLKKYKNIGIEKYIYILKDLLLRPKHNNFEQTDMVLLPLSWILDLKIPFLLCVYSPLIFYFYEVRIPEIAVEKFIVAMC